ncbi:hypothetical protein GCM10010129_84430 [Streptomyces fumigatiscleroticus]|nr:hypothetical protein GCM10010129_84430 [Streptomyces fumigatiscleroticus]
MRGDYLDYFEIKYEIVIKIINMLLLFIMKIIMYTVHVNYYA